MNCHPHRDGDPPMRFKAATFADERHNKVLRELEADIDAATLDGRDVKVKLKVIDSLFVPEAKWRAAIDRSATPCPVI